MTPMAPCTENRFRYSFSSDIFEHANSLDEWVDNRYHQLERKANFQGSILDYSFRDKVRITKETIDTPLIEQIGRVPADKVLFLNIQSDSDILLNGRFVNSGTFHVSSGRPIHAVARSPIRCFIVTIDKDYFFENMAPESKIISSRLPFETYITPANGSVIDFEHFASEHFVEGNIGFSNDSHIQHSFDKVVGSISEIMLASNDGAHVHAALSQTTRAYIVDKSCEFFFNNFDNQELGVLELCNHLRVSRRTLQYSFESILGISPSNYIRNVRLNVARKILLPSPLDKIQGAALGAGFSHLGRFSKYYHDFYGELPSQTLGRQLKSL